MNSIRLISRSLKYQMFTPSACKDIETWILEIVARAHGSFISEVSL